MDNDLFDSIDINDLANSEEAIIESSSLKTPQKEKINLEIDVEDFKNKGSNGKGPFRKIENEKRDDSDAVDLSLLESEDTDDPEEENDDPEGSTIDNKEKKAPAKSTQASSSSQQSALPSLALVLHEAGVFSSLEDDEVKEIKNVEDIIKAVEKQIKSNELADLTDEDKEYLKARRNGISHTAYVQSKSTTEQYEKLTDELIEKTPQIQYELIRRSLLIKGVDEKAADKYAVKIVNSEDEDDDSVKEAIDARNALVKHEKDSLNSKLELEKKKNEDKIQEEKTKLDKLKSKINESSEVLPGIKVNSQTKEKIFASMTTPVKSKEGQLQNEVMEMYGSDPEYKMKIHAIHVLTKGFTDFTKFKTEAKSKATEELDRILKQTGNGSGGSGSHRQFNKTDNPFGNGSGGGYTSKEIVAALPDFSK